MLDIGLPRAIYTVPEGSVPLVQHVQERKNSVHVRISIRLSIPPLYIDPRIRLFRDRYDFALRKLPEAVYIIRRMPPDRPPRQPMAISAVELEGKNASFLQPDTHLPPPQEIIILSLYCFYCLHPECHLG